MSQPMARPPSSMILVLRDQRLMTWLGLSLVLGMSLVVRLWNVKETGIIDSDMASYTMYGEYFWDLLTGKRPVYSGLPVYSKPGFLALVTVTVGVLGERDYLILIINAVAGTLNGYLCYVIARRLGIRAPVALLVAMIALFTPSIFWTDRRGLPGTTATTWVLFAFLAFIRFEALFPLPAARWWLYVAGLLTGIAVLFHPTQGIYFLVFFMSVGLTLVFQRRFGGWANVRLLFFFGCAEIAPFLFAAATYQIVMGVWPVLALGRPTHFGGGLLAEFLWQGGQAMGIGFSAGDFFGIFNLFPIRPGFIRFPGLQEILAFQFHVLAVVGVIVSLSTAFRMRVSVPGLLVIGSIVPLLAGLVRPGLAPRYFEVSSLFYLLLYGWGLNYVLDFVETRGKALAARVVPVFLIALSANGFGPDAKATVNRMIDEMPPYSSTFLETTYVKQLFSNFKQQGAKHVIIYMPSYYSNSWQYYMYHSLGIGGVPRNCLPCAPRPLQFQTNLQKLQEVRDAINSQPIDFVIMRRIYDSHATPAIRKAEEDFIKYFTDRGKKRLEELGNLKEISDRFFIYDTRRNRL